MFQTAMLDVLIGMSFVYLLMSLAVTSAQEWLSAVLRRRARTLSQSLEQLLDHPDVRDHVFEHPLIKTFRQMERRLPGQLLKTIAPRVPSYVSPKAFCAALLDALPAAPQDSSKPSHTSVKSPDRSQSSENSKATIDRIRHFIESADDSKSDLRRTLRVLFEDAEGDLTRFRAHIQSWFNAAMNRTSIRYKRNTHYQLIVVATVITLMGNVDSLAIINSLWRDPSLRTALVTQVQTAVNNPTSYQVQTASLTNETPAPPCYPPEDEPVNDAEERFKARWEDLVALSLPVGWPKSPEGVLAEFSRHGIGWLMTILAVSLGAPFWFDLLNKIVSLRLAGAAPDEVKERAAERRRAATTQRRQATSNRKRPTSSDGNSNV